MRLLIAIFFTWFAIVLWPEKTARPAPPVEEKVFMSTTCSNSRWYLEESDDQSATLACYPQAPPAADDDEPK